MKLISLDIHGFKSFPEATHIQFHEGITAIVGPNGSGKSNIADALLWVLGEQSVKSLRGSKMQDLIFSGTSQRKPLAYAEVVLTLDNSDQELKLDFATVEIKRRLYRNGDSEYAINQQRCRLKDIIDLFLDSGLGKNGYSLVGQGRIDEILSARYEDRRLIFDEAAGISKYRKRKEEAEQKLQQTEDNLLRVQDIQREIGLQLHALEQQAEAAGKYLDLQERFGKLDRQRLFYELQDYSSKNQELTADLKILNDNIADKEKEKEALISANTAQQEKLNCLRNQIDSDSDSLQVTSDKLLRTGQQLEISQLNITKLQQNEQEKLADQRDLEKEIADLTLDLAREAEVESDIRKSIDLSIVAFNNLQAEFGDKLTSALQRENEWQEKFRLLEQDKKAYWEQQNQYATIQAEEAAYQSRLQVEKDNLSKQNSTIRQLQQDCTAAQKNLVKMQTIEQETEKSLQTAIECYNESKHNLQEISKVVETAEAELNNLTYRQHSLQQAADNYEGFNQSVRQLLTYIQKQKLYAKDCVLGSLADLITVPAEYTYAIDTALGQSLQNIVTDNAKTAAELIYLLKEKHFGRANFLPLANLKAHCINLQQENEIKRVRGFVGLAADLVECPPECRIAVNYRLGRILIADNMTTAEKLSDICDRRYQIVTLEGDQINVGGAMAGGEKQKHSPTLLLLQRQREIRKIAQEAEKKAQDLKGKQQEFQIAENKLSQAELDLSKQKQLMEKVHLQLAESKQIVQQKTLQLQELQKQYDIAENDYEKGQSVFHSTYKNLAEKLKIHKENEEKLKERDLALQTLREELNNAAQNDTQIQQKLHQAELELNERRGELKVVLEKISNIRERSETLQSKKNNYQTLLQLIKHDLSEEEDKAKNLQVAYMQVEKDKKAAETALAEKKRHLSEFEQSNSGAFKQLNEIHALLSKLEAQSVRLQGQQEREEQKRQQLLQELWENYQLSLNDVPESKDPTYQPKKVTAELADLRTKIKELGTVNIDAIKQYEELQTRYDFIEQQHNDIIAGKKELDQLIAQITTAMREKFSESFRLINRNFQDIFVKLFGGGQGEICLETENDVLTSNIEIKACPPGKRMQNMLLLSGGERCLTAIALLFAIQELKPSAFCLLDEVEAALDDANIFRFTEFLQKQALQTQFIVVTHRKSTMSACARIYGVTMQERGVSQVLTLALAEDKDKFSKLIE